MRRWLLFALLVVAAGVLGVAARVGTTETWAAEPTTGTVTGTTVVEISGGCGGGPAPIQGPPCVTGPGPDRVVIYDTSARIAVATSSGANGRFTVRLPAGTYSLHDWTGAVAQSVTITAGGSADFGTFAISEPPMP